MTHAEECPTCGGLFEDRQKYRDIRIRAKHVLVIVRHLRKRDLLFDIGTSGSCQGMMG